MLASGNCTPFPINGEGDWRNRLDSCATAMQGANAIAANSRWTFFTGSILTRGLSSRLRRLGRTGVDFDLLHARDPSAHCLLVERNLDEHPIALSAFFQGNGIGGEPHAGRQ